MSASQVRMPKRSSSLDSSITRREAIRRAVLFSTGAWAAGRYGAVQGGLPRTDYQERGLHLLAFGDFGTKGNADQTAVAQQMAAFARKLNQPLDAVLALGDNFYTKITANRFERHFEQMYSQQDLSCPFYACAGNHDYGTALYDFQEGKLQMQLDYAKNNPESRWKFPAKWYTIELPDAKDPLVKIIVLDGSYWEGALTPKEKVEQRRFFAAELKNPTKARWIWMVNHYPLFSESADRGDNTTLIREWGKYLQDYPVSLAFAGHDHMLQHLQVEGYQPSFIVSGAGGARLYDLGQVRRGFAHNRTLGFTHIYVTATALEVQFISVDGEMLHAFTRDREGRIEGLSRPLVTA